MSSERQLYTDDKEPHGVRIKGTNFVILSSHPCSVCGHVDAPFGVGVFLKRGHVGKWYCREHLPPADQPAT
jgi:hypothetical protein